MCVRLMGWQLDAMESIGILYKFEAFLYVCASGLVNVVKALGKDMLPWGMVLCVLQNFYVRGNYWNSWMVV